MGGEIFEYINGITQEVDWRQFIKSNFPAFDNFDNNLQGIGSQSWIMAFNLRRKIEYLTCKVLQEEA